MERDYSHIQGSDYAYVPQKPQQPNLIQGLFEAFNGFKDARAGKVAEDEAKAEKEKQKLQGELKSQRDEEDRQLNRKRVQGEIDLTEAKKLGLGKPKASGKSGESLTRARKIIGGLLAHERGLDDMGLEEYKASPTYQAELDSYFSALHQAKEAGDKLDASEMKHYENLSESFFKRNGGAPVASADSTGAQNATVTQDGGFGKRPDGTDKGKGFLGARDLGNGKVASEYSVGVNLGGKEVLIPTYVPTLSEDQLKRLDEAVKAGKTPDKDIVDTAAQFAISRLKEGKSPFVEEGEQSPAPAIQKKPSIADIQNKGGLNILGGVNQQVQQTDQSQPADKVLTNNLMGTQSAMGEQIDRWTDPKSYLEAGKNVVSGIAGDATAKGAVDAIVPPVVQDYASKIPENLGKAAMALSPEIIGEMMSDVKQLIMNQNADVNDMVSPNLSAKEAQSVKNVLANPDKYPEQAKELYDSIDDTIQSPYLTREGVNIILEAYDRVNKDKPVDQNYKMPEIPMVGIDKLFGTKPKGEVAKVPQINLAASEKPKQKPKEKSRTLNVEVLQGRR